MIWIIAAVVFFLLSIAVVAIVIFSGTRTQPGDFCTIDSDCDSGQVCNIGQCKVNTGGECNGGADCISGDVCFDNTCMTTGS